MGWIRTLDLPPSLFFSFFFARVPDRHAEISRILVSKKITPEFILGQDLHGSNS